MVKVVKASGEQEEFSEDKLISSIKRAGVEKDLQMQALEHIKAKLRPNIPTSEIYSHISEFLEKSQTPYSKARYSLKKAIMDLGPTGYPFEDYIAKVLQSEGYSTSVRNIISGKCISHEIDVIAKKDNMTTMVEAKFHNSNGIKTDVHVALYTWARFEDTQQKNNFSKAMLVTNTKLTTDAVTFAQCVGMQILGWSYPEGKSLRDLVEKYYLFPITVLTNLPNPFLQSFLEKGIVLCRDLCMNPSLVQALDLPEDKKKQILDEVNFLCKS